MSPQPFRTAAVASIVWAVVMIAGCAVPPISKESITVSTATVSGKLPYSVSVAASVEGGMGRSSIAASELKAAIESSITRAGLFSAVVQGDGGDYDLAVTVVNLARPNFGASFKVDMEAGWVLTRRSDRSIVLRKSIESTHTTRFYESPLGAMRLRLAVEGAARANIALGMQAIAGLQPRPR